MTAAMHALEQVLHSNSTPYKSEQKQSGIELGPYGFWCNEGSYILDGVLVKLELHLDDGTRTEA